MDKCRTDSPSYHDIESDDSLKLDHLTQPEINERVKSWYIWADGCNTDTQVNLDLAIDNLIANEDKDVFENFWTELKIAMLDGQFTELKDAMDKYVEVEIDLGEDNWL